MATYNAVRMRPVLKTRDDVDPPRHAGAKGYRCWPREINNKERLRTFVHLAQEIPAHRLTAREGFPHVRVYDEAHLGAQRLIFQRLHQRRGKKCLPGLGTRLPGGNQPRRIRISTPLLRAARVFLSSARKEQAALFRPNVPALLLLELERVGSLFLL